MCILWANSCDRLQVYPRDFKRVLKENKAKEAAAKETAEQEAELMSKDAFAELQKLAAQSPAFGLKPSSNGASKVRC